MPNQIFGIDIANYIWIALATLMALPAVLGITWNNVSRARALSMIFATIGDLAGSFLTAFIWITALSSTSIDGAVVFAVALFVALVTGIAGALLASALVGSGPARSDSTQVEY